MEVTCRDIYGHLGIVIPANTPPPYIEGFIIFEVFFGPPLPASVPDDPLDVEGIYTYFGSPFTQGVSIDVQANPLAAAVTTAAAKAHLSLTIGQMSTFNSSA